MHLGLSGLVLALPVPLFHFSCNGYFGRMAFALLCEFGQLLWCVMNQYNGLALSDAHRHYLQCLPRTS